MRSYGEHVVATIMAVPGSPTRSLPGTMDDWARARCRRCRVRNRPEPSLPAGRRPRTSVWRALAATNHSDPAVCYHPDADCQRDIERNWSPRSPFLPPSSSLRPNSLPRGPQGPLTDPAPCEGGRSSQSRCTPEPPFPPASQRRARYLRGLLGPPCHHSAPQSLWGRSSPSAQASRHSMRNRTRHRIVTVCTNMPADGIAFASVPRGHPPLWLTPDLYRAGGHSLPIPHPWAIGGGLKPFDGQARQGYPTVPTLKQTTTRYGLYVSTTTTQGTRSSICIYIVHTCVHM